MKQWTQSLGTATGVLEFRGTGRAVAQLKVSTPVLAISLLDVRGRKPRSTMTPASGTAAERVLIAPGQPVISTTAYSLIPEASIGSHTPGQASLQHSRGSNAFLPWSLGRDSLFGVQEPNNPFIKQLVFENANSSRRFFLPDTGLPRL